MSTAASDPTERTDLVRAMSRQRSGRRRVAVAAAAVVFGLVSAACTTANASPVDEIDRSGWLVSSAAEGHAGHGAPAAEDPDGNDPAADEYAEEDAEKDGQDGDKDKADRDKDGRDKADKDRDGKDRDGKDKDGRAKADKDGKDGKDGDEPDNGLDVLGRDCSNSDLPAHTGFQESPACVDTAFGEVAAADKSPALLITEFPREVQVGESFTLKVSTRNLVRDRFLGAGAGGYYLESSFLDEDGIQRGHFHTACRMLPSLDEAPDSSLDPAFFVATQDNKGGAGTDTVEVVVTGLPEAGTAQCTSWAGDGSHRIPMMQRANQTPAVDSVRITVE